MAWWSPAIVSKHQGSTIGLGVETEHPGAKEFPSVRDCENTFERVVSFLPPFVYPV